VAVLTNGSLLWDVGVQQALMEADLVMPSLDAGDEATFQQVNRPHREIAFQMMVEGLAAFTARFRRLVWLEVLLVEGVTGAEPQVDKIAALAHRIRPGRVQLNTVSRPPAEGFARAVPRERLLGLAQRFSTPVELISDSGPARATSMSPGAVTDPDILDLLRRRPCTAAGIATGLSLHIQEVAKQLEALVKTGAVAVLQKNNETFYCLRSPT
jgi:wyosine [tRNA(Phe)-imidazoG37] synthetase (radical SAM superfamily)